MWCNVCGAGIVHAANHATLCPHCGMYCGPAACSMYAGFKGRLAPFVNQDDIYDNGKSAQGEIMGNGTLETSPACAEMLRTPRGMAPATKVQSTTPV